MPAISIWSVATAEPISKNHYLSMVQDTIDKQWIAPPVPIQIPVVVTKFRVTRSGEITQIQLEQGSGNAAYDAAAQQAVSACNPLPPFPDDLTEEYLDVRFHFVKQ